MTYFFEVNTKTCRFSSPNAMKLVSNLSEETLIDGGLTENSHWYSGATSYEGWCSLCRHPPGSPAARTSPVMHVSPKSKKAFAQLVHEQCRKEVNNYSERHTFPELNRDNLASFKWLNMMYEVSEDMPILYVLSGALRKRFSGPK